MFETCWQVAPSNVQKTIDSLLDLMEQGGKDSKDLLERLKERAKERDALKAQLDTLDQAKGSDPLTGLEEKVRAKIGKTLQNLTDATMDAFRDELKRYISKAELHEDGRVRLVGTLDGLIEGAPSWCEFGSGGGL